MQVISVAGYVSIRVHSIPLRVLHCFTSQGLSAVIAVGDVLMLPDLQTGASKKPVLRPCMVVAISGAIVLVAPRSASVKGKVPTPAGVAKGLNKEGSFSGWRCRVSRNVAEVAENLGPLAEPYYAEVLALHRPKKTRK